MPASPAAPPPAAPAKTPAGVAPPSAGEIHVTAPAAGEGNPTVAPPKPGTAKGDMFSKLRAKAGVPDQIAPPDKSKAPDPDPDARPGDAPPDNQPTDPSPDQQLGDKKPDVSAAPPTTPEDRKKVSPWKLVDQFKERATKAEARALELEKNVIPEAKRKETEERLSSYEKRVAEMQDDLRYFNAEKYDPDIIKANAEYVGAFNRALDELSELSVTDSATGQPRALNGNDIATLISLPLGEARKIADEVFGVFADDVMAHRKEIKTLLLAKTAKLEELKKNGSERDKQRQEQFQKMNGELAGHIKTAWEAENAAVLAHEKHGKFFKPREGDADWNTRLERGYKLVDDAWAMNVNDPRLTKEQREMAVKKNVAVRNRAAAFEAIRLDFERLQAKYDAEHKKLEAYEKSTPGAGGTVPASAAPVAGGAFNQFRDKLRQLAK